MTPTKHNRIRFERKRKPKTNNSLTSHSIIQSINNPAERFQMMTTITTTNQRVAKLVLLPVEKYPKIGSCCLRSSSACVVVFSDEGCGHYDLERLDKKKSSTPQCFYFRSMLAMLLCCHAPRARNHVHPPHRTFVKSWQATWIFEETISMAYVRGWTKPQTVGQRV